MSIETKEQPRSSYEMRLSELESVLNENSPEKESKLVEDTMEKFDSQTEAKTIGISTNNFIEGPINSQSEIKRAHFVDGFKLDDPAMYEELLESIKTLKSQPGWDSTRALIPTAIQYTISKYYGNQRGQPLTESLNQKFYMDRSSVDSEKFSVAELKGKGIAVCAEKAAAAQNLNSFAGIESYMVVSPDSKLHGEDGPAEAHMYNIIHTENGYFLFDPANQKSDVVESTKANILRPAMYKLTDEDFQKIKGGEAVTVAHEDRYFENDELKTTNTNRIYTGPKPNVPR